MGVDAVARTRVIGGVGEMVGDHPQQCLSLKWFNQVVNGSEREGPLGIFSFFLSGDENDRHIGERLIPPHPAADFVAVHVRHNGVEQNKIRFCVFERRQGLRGTSRRQHGIPVIDQCAFETSHGYLVVIDA